MQLDNIFYLSLEEIRSLLCKGEVSCKTLILEMLKRCHEMKHLNAYVTLCAEHAMKAADDSYNRLMQIQNIRPLEGIPICVKDLFCTKDINTTACSDILRNFNPTYNASVLNRLSKSGAISVGKTNMDEFAMGSSNENSCFGPSRNPWNITKVTGGSSGGTAAAIAAGLAYGGLGSDTGGSIRQPAALCGIVGIKPSYGRCSRHGMIGYASSFDQPAVMARSVQDACMILDQIMGPCPMDTNMIQSKPPILSNVEPNLTNRKIGYFSIIDEMLDNDSVRRTWEMTLSILKKQGVEVLSIDPKDFDSISTDDDPMRRWLAVYYTLTPAEALSNLTRYDGVRYGNPGYPDIRDNLGSEVKRRILLGAHTLSTKHENKFFDKATKYRSVIQNDFCNLFKHFDAIISPTSLHEAWDIGYKFTNTSDMYYEDVFTVIANIIKSPSISIPVCLGINNMPMGIQIMCDYMNETCMIEIAKAMEAELRFNDIRKMRFNSDQRE